MLKKLLFSLVLLAAAINANAQCTPGSNYADSLFGAWPDTTTNFPDALTNVFYTTDLNFKVPLDAGDIDPLFAGTPINEFVVDSVIGLPQGMNYTCNVSSCTYAGGSNGCAQITGTSNTPGMTDITIYITATLEIFGFPVPYPYSFEGYHINVIQNSAALAEYQGATFSVFPNPVNSVLKMIHVPSGISKVDVLNAEGKVLFTKSLTENTDLDVKSLENGVYFLKAYSADKHELIRFVKAD